MCFAALVRSRCDSKVTCYHYSKQVSKLNVSFNSVICSFPDVKYRNDNVLGEAFRCTITCLLDDKEVPVKVEAAIALQMMLSSQGEKAKGFVEPHIGKITMELLQVIRDTENDDLTTVMQKIICTYTDQLVPLAANICSHLVDTFNQVTCRRLIQVLLPTVIAGTAKKLHCKQVSLDEFWYKNILLGTQKLNVTVV